MYDATAISTGAIIGAGIFIVTGIATGFAGSALVISMLIAAVIALFSALSFAELTAWQPKEGSVYEYTYQLVSPFAGFLVGWMWILSNTFTGAAVSLGFAYYLIVLFPILPANWIAAIICIAFTILNFIGMRQSALLNNILVTAKLLILAFFVIYGLGYINTAHFASFAPFETGVLQGAFYIFFAYGGFARVAVIFEEIKNPKHNVPRAIILSLIISTTVKEDRLFQYKFPETLWESIRRVVRNLAKLSMWKNRELVATAFGGKQNYDYWHMIFESGKSPQGLHVLPQGINLDEALKE